MDCESVPGALRATRCWFLPRPTNPHSLIRLRQPNPTRSRISKHLRSLKEPTPTRIVRPDNNVVTGHPQSIRRSTLHGPIGSVEHQRVTLPPINISGPESRVEHIVSVRCGERDSSTVGDDQCPESIEPFDAANGGSKFLGLRPDPV